MKRIILSIFILFYGSHAHAENFMTTAFDKFANVVFFSAWPTATYEDHMFFDINNSEKYITVKMTGKSMWDNKLELLIKVKFTQDNLYKDIEVERHNGIMEPFAIAGELVKLIKQMNASSSGGGSSTATPNYAYNEPTKTETSYDIIVHNECSASIKLAIHYRTTEGEWKTESWWVINGNESSYLSTNNKRLTTRNNVVYAYAVRQYEANGRAWDGNAHTEYIGGEKIGFRKITDDDGDHDIYFNCN